MCILHCLPLIVGVSGYMVIGTDHTYDFSTLKLSIGELAPHKTTTEDVEIAGPFRRDVSCG